MLRATFKISNILKRPLNWTPSVLHRIFALHNSIFYFKIQQAFHLLKIVWLPFDINLCEF